MGKQSEAQGYTLQANSQRRGGRVPGYTRGTQLGRGSQVKASLEDTGPQEIGHGYGSKVTGPRKDVGCGDTLRENRQRRRQGAGAHLGQTTRLGSSHAEACEHTGPQETGQDTEER
jgi:hypothetical protein